MLEFIIPALTCYTTRPLKSSEERAIALKKRVWMGLSLHGMRVLIAGKDEIGRW